MCGLFIERELRNRDPDGMECYLGDSSKEFYRRLSFSPTVRRKCIITIHSFFFSKNFSRTLIKKRDSFILFYSRKYRLVKGI